MSDILIIIFSLIGGQATVLAVVHFGVRAFQKWFMSDVINPHVKPMQEDIKAMKNEQMAMAALVARHDGVLEEQGKHIAMLQGKVFGGFPSLDRDK